MVSITIQGATNVELHTQLVDLAARFAPQGAVAAPAKDAPNAAAATAARVAGTTATTTAPKTPGKTAAQIKKEAADAAAKKAAEDAAAEAAAAGAGDEDPFDEGGEGAEEPVYTMEDLRALLTEVRDANPSKPTIVADLIKEHGGNGTAKIANVKPEFFTALYNAAKAELPAA